MSEVVKHRKIVDSRSALDPAEVARLWMDLSRPRPAPAACCGRVVREQRGIAESGMDEHAAAIDAAGVGRAAAVLLDRDGTLIANVPYNGDPDLVQPLPTVAEALELLRSAGVPTAVVSNQSGIGRGLVTAAQVDAVNARTVELLGSIGPWLYCPHTPDDNCLCRKPQPGLLHEAARVLGVDIARCVVIGDALTDIEAARRAGCRAILVPTRETPAATSELAEVTATTLSAAVNLVLER